MKPITVEDLTNRLDQDLSWRKKELIFLKNRANGCKPVAQGCFIRSGIALSYAHWEGFVKNSSNEYLAFVFSQRKKYEELNDNFFGILICKELSKYSESKKQYIYSDFSVNNISKYKEKTELNPSTFIDTQSNLTPTLFREILSILGIKEELFITKDKFIDEKILKNRHDIAHGRRSDNFSYNDLEEITSEVIKMLTEYKELLLDYATNKKYLKEIEI